MKAVMATKHMVPLFNGGNVGIQRYRNNNQIQVMWPYPVAPGSDPAYWSFLASNGLFVRWVDAGFPVCCATCWHVGGSAYRDCAHVQFDVALSEQAHRTAKVIQMGLL